jgi:hypothetical protein
MATSYCDDNLVLIRQTQALQERKEGKKGRRKEIHGSVQLNYIQVLTE